MQFGDACDDGQAEPRALAVALALWRGSGEGSQAAADTVLLTALAALAAVGLRSRRRPIPA